LDLVEAAIQRERHPAGAQRRLGIDVARYGDDRTVFLLRAGPNVEKVRIESKLSVMEVVGIAVQLIHRWKAQMVYVDTIGIGAGVYDRLAELRKELDDYGLPKIPPLVQLVPVNVAEKAPERSVQNLETIAYGIIYGWRWRAGFVKRNLRSRGLIPKLHRISRGNSPACVLQSTAAAGRSLNPKMP